MAKKRQKQKERVNLFTARKKKKIQTHTADIPLVTDIENSASGGIFYGNKDVYIHSHGRNFATAAQIANKNLRTIFSQVKNAWAIETKQIIEYCNQNEQAFFAELNKNQIEGRTDFNKENFAVFVKQYLKPVSIIMDKQWDDVSLIPRGEKEPEELQKLVELYNQIATILSDEKSSIVDDSFIKKMIERKTKIQDLINKQAVGKKLAKKDFRNTGASVTSLSIYVLPKMLEELLLSRFGKLVGNKNVERTSGNTQKGTSGDQKIFSASISIKSGEQKVKQAKSKILSTFFDFNEQLKQEQADGSSIIGTVNATLNDLNAINIFNYLLMNFSAINGFNDQSLLTDALKIIIMSSLNEKLFGYNKSKQTQSVSDLVKEFPVAVINKSGDFIYLSDIMDDLIKTLNADNVLKLATCSLYSRGFSKHSELRQKKKEALQLLSAQNKVINYANLKDLIESELKRIREELLSSIQLKIQYNVNVETILQQLE